MPNPDGDSEAFIPVVVVVAFSFGSSRHNLVEKKRVINPEVFLEHLYCVASLSSCARKRVIVVDKCWMLPNRDNNSVAYRLIVISHTWYALALWRWFVHAGMIEPPCS